MQPEAQPAPHPTARREIAGERTEREPNPHNTHGVFEKSETISLDQMKGCVLAALLRRPMRDETACVPETGGVGVVHVGGHRHMPCGTRPYAVYIHGVHIPRTQIDT